MGCEALVVAEVEDDGRDWDVRMLSRPAERGRKGKQDQLDRPKADDSSLACGLKGPSLTYFLLQHLYSRSRLPRLVEGTLVVPLRADERRQEQEGWREEVTGQLDSNVVAAELDGVPSHKWDMDWHQCISESGCEKQESDIE